MLFPRLSLCYSPPHFIFFFIDFFVYFLLRFSHITHTPRVRVCAAETRQLTKRVLFCSCSCSLSRSLFVQLCVCTAVIPSFALTPLLLLPPHLSLLPPTLVAARFVYCYSHQCWTRVFPECLLCLDSWIADCTGQGMREQGGGEAGRWT